jgi:MFS family permease
MLSGVVSDRMTSRKAAIAAGFAMGAAAKAGLSHATTLPQLFVGKAIDRLGNGVQAAPRDALIGDLSPAASRSACFGYAQSMRKAGSFLGAGLAFALMKATGDNYKLIFLGAAGVSAAATAAFLMFVPAHARSDRQQQQQQQQAQQQTQQQQQQQQVSKREGFAAAVTRLAADVKAMGRDFWRTLGVIGLYGLAHINESMLEARAIEVGFGKAEATLVVALLCLSVSLCAYPLGRLDDAKGPRTTFAVGMLALAAGDLVLLLSGVWPPAVFAACVLWGAHWAVVQGPMLAVVVGLAPPHLRGTALGVFYTLMALTAVVANTLYGSLWHAHGAGAAFALSAAVIAVALAALPRLLPPARRAEGGEGGDAAAAAAAA